MVWEEYLSSATPRKLKGVAHRVMGCSKRYEQQEFGDYIKCVMVYWYIHMVYMVHFKGIVEMCKTCCEMLSRRMEGVEKEGSRWIKEEPVWKREKSIKWVYRVNRPIGQFTHLTELCAWPWQSILFSLLVQFLTILCLDTLHIIHAHVCEQKCVLSQNSRYITWEVWVPASGEGPQTLGTEGLQASIQEGPGDQDATAGPCQVSTTSYWWDPHVVFVPVCLCVYAINIPSSPVLFVVRR